MRSALAQKSITDLTRRRSRTFFAVATLALAVASIGLLAMPALMNRSMQAEVRSGKLPDLTVWTGALVLDDARLGSLASLRNVQAVEPHSFFGGRVYVGARRAAAYVIGVPDFAHQTADIVHVASGSPPREGEVLTDAQNAHQGLLRAGAGDTVRIIAADGSVRTLRISGEGRNLDGGQNVTSDNVVVLYATPATVSMLSGVQGFSSLAFRLDDPSGAAVTKTIADVRANLRSVPGFTGFSDLPTVRAAGDWPGKSDFDSIAKFFYVITVLALLSALVLISNTMTTLVAQQTSEIGVMKAIGGRRRQIALAYVKTALLLGALGTVAGVALGLVLTNLLVRYFGSTFFAIDAGFQVDPKVLALSVAVGLLAPPLAAWPAIHRSVRVDLRESLEATGSAVGGQDAGDRLLRRVSFLPRTAQIGLRNLGRRRRRSLATALIVALAVGNLLAVLGLAASISQTSHASWGDHGEDVKVTSIGSRPLDARAVRLMRATPGVAAAEPMFASDSSLAGKDAVIWSVRQQTMFRYRISHGPLVHRRRRARSRAGRRDRGEHRARHGNAPGRRRQPRDRCGSLPVPHRRDRGQPAGVRHGDLRAPDDHAHDPRRVPGGHERLLGADDLSRPRADRPDNNPARGHAYRPRLRRRHRGRVRSRGGRGRYLPHVHDRDRRTRLPDHRNQHGRARQRDHHERDRAHP